MKTERRRPSPVWAFAISSALLGCTSAHSVYSPSLVARGELTAHYDDGIQMYAGNRVVAESYSYDGLEHHVRCVPDAKRHASEASSSGTAAVTLSTLGIVLGVGSLGGLGGLAYYDKDPQVMAVWLGSGIAVGITAVVLGALSRTYKAEAHGNALDAMNYYNDAVGSYGATCDDLVYPAPAGPAPPPPPVPSSIDEKQPNQGEAPKQLPPDRFVPPGGDSDGKDGDAPPPPPPPDRPPPSQTDI